MLNIFLETDLAKRIPDDCLKMIITRYLKENNVCSICYNHEDLNIVEGAGYICCECIY